MTVFAANTRHLLPVLVAALACLLLVAEGASGGARAKQGKPARDTQAPTAPINLRVTAATTSSIAIAWDPSTDNVGVRGYSVYVNGDRTNVSGTSFVIWRLTCGESVAVEVSAYDKAQNRSPRTGATVSAAPCPDTTPPSAPAGFRQSATSETAVVLAWNPSTDDTSVVGYGVYRSGLPLTASPEATVTLSELACGSTYEYAVDAVDGAGNRSARSPVWVHTSDCPAPPPADTQPPTTPVTSVGTKTTSSLVLQWQPATDNVGVLRYDLFLGTSGVSASSQEKVGETSGLSFTFGGLDCGTDYSLAVQAVDAAGNKSPLADAFRFPVRTLDCPPLPPPPDTTPPSTPTNLAVASASTSSIALTWTASTDNVGVTGYGVYRNGTALPSVTQTGATVSGLLCGTAYTLEVDAFDAAANRSSRASVTASTAACPDTQAPTAPANVVASSRTTDSIALTWSPSTDAVGVTGYGLYRGGQPAGTATGTTGIFSGLTCDTPYTLSVDAYDAAGNRSSKTTVMVSTTACPPPPSPTITMGESSVLSTNDSGNGNLLVSQKATLAQNGVLRRMSFYVTTASGNLRMAVYAANGASGGPGTILAETSSFTPTAGWNTVDVLAPVTLAAGSYWLAYLPSSSTLAFRAGGPGEARWTSYSYGPPPATFPATTSSGTVRWSFYATLDVTNETPTPLPPPPPAAQCADGADNDGDGAVDMADPGCTGVTDNDETNSASPSPTPPPPGTGTPTLQQIDGGTSYFSQFTGASSMDAPDFFPIGVWGSYAHELSNIAKDKAVGLNTYVWFSDPNPTYLANARSQNMKVIVNRSEGGTAVGSETVGRLLDDEMDMQEGPSACPTAINQIKSSLPSDGRFRYANYGKGVQLWESDAQAACFVNAQDITSYDMYWHTDPNELGRAQSGKSWGYGWSMRRMRYLDSLDGVRKPQWGFVEVGWPWSENQSQYGGQITPAELRGAVWHNIVAGARGIIYFQHNFTGPCPTSHALRDPCYQALIDMATSVDAQIKSLAPVLNSPFVTSGSTASTSIDHMVKWNGSNFYVFAAARSSGSATVSMPCIGNATATVLGENGRTVAVTNGSLTDGFADGNAVHIYRIDGGSTCGLS
jgi:chitodextrinase